MFRSCSPATRLSALIGTAILLLPTTLRAGEPGRDISGLVVDEHGRPVANADVTYVWRANGPINDENGNPIPDERIFWGNVGKMFPLGERPAKTTADGRFLLPVPYQFHALLALDTSCQTGGLAILPDGRRNAELKIALRPLVRLKGALEGPNPGNRPVWTYVSAELPVDPERPLDMTLIATCGSFGARFEMSLPPGRYLLSGYNDPAREKDQTYGEFHKEVVLTGKAPLVDVGTLRLAPKLSLDQRKARARTAGTWRDYTQHYGEKPPHWHAVDARGVSKHVQSADFKGRWLLVEFWGLSCYSCLRHGLPKLMQFYDDHQAERDQFEILAICIDEEGELKSIADLDRKLEPIVKHVWGRPLPFPILLDNTFETWERFGLPGLGTVLLIDPEGNLVNGGEAVLAEKLRKPARPARGKKN